MFSAANLRVKRIADVSLCRLVYGTTMGKVAVGMVVQNPFNVEAQGVLYLPPVPSLPPLSYPAFSPGDMSVMDLGQNAEFHWSGLVSAISEGGAPGRDVGLLAVSQEEVVIVGKAFGGTYRPDQFCYWNIATGKLTSYDNIRNATCINQWQVGWRDIAEEFHAVGQFPTVAASD